MFWIYEIAYKRLKKILFYIYVRKIINSGGIQMRSLQGKMHYDSQFVRNEQAKFKSKLLDLERWLLEVCGY